MRSSGQKRPKRGKTSRSLKLGLAAALLTCSGAAAGMFMDGVSETILTFREDSVTPPERPFPASANVAQVAAAEPQPIAHQPEPEPVWFPANNAVQWGISIRPGQTTTPVAISNGQSKQNGIVRFYRATGSTSSPWQPAATLHVRAGASANIRLPEGQYLVARTAAPATVAYEAAASRKPDETTQLVVGPNSAGTIQVAIDQTGSMPVQNPSIPHRYALASSQRHYTAAAYRPARPSRSLTPVRSTVTVASAGEREEYAGLVEAALDET